jgi:hypothetical protein
VDLLAEPLRWFRPVNRRTARSWVNGFIDARKEPLDERTTTLLGLR